ncbi:MAG: NAD(P)-binding domain-containing protein, partial [Bacillota bacterium]|nr:NAD(P)-binding domain-containing protein [Bacillota bacterium]
MEHRKIGFIGGGVMAEVIIKGIIEKKLITPADIWLYDIDTLRTNYLKQQYKINIAIGNQELVQEVEMVILAVKPQVVAKVLQEISGEAWIGKQLTSIVA